MVSQPDSQPDRANMENMGLQRQNETHGNQICLENTDRRKQLNPKADANKFTVML